MRLRSKFETGAVRPIDEEPHVGGSFTDDHRVSVGEVSPVDVDREIACGEAGERTHHAALKRIAWSARADCFTDGERKQLTYAQRRGKRECRGAA